MSLRQPLSSLLHRSVSLAKGRPRQRSSEPLSRKAQIRLALLFPSNPSLVAITAQLHDRSAGYVISARILNGRVEDAMRRTKAASFFLHSPSSHCDVRRLTNGSCKR